MKESLFDLDGDPGVEREWQDVCRRNIPGNPKCVINWIRMHMKNYPSYYQRKASEARAIFHENGITGYDDDFYRLILSGT